MVVAVVGVVGFVGVVTKKDFHLGSGFIGGITGREQDLKMHSWLPPYFQLTAVQPFLLTQDSWRQKLKIKNH